MAKLLLSLKIHYAGKKLGKTGKGVIGLPSKSNRLNTRLLINSRNFHDSCQIWRQVFQVFQTSGHRLNYTAEHQLVNYRANLSLMPWLQLRFDYDMTTIRLRHIRRDSTWAKNEHVNFSLQSCRSRIVVESNASRNFDHFHHSQMHQWYRCIVDVS